MKYLFVALLLIATAVFPSSIYAHKHEYKWARVFQNGQRVPFQGLCSVKFQGFGAKCGGTKYFFRVDL